MDIRSYFKREQSSSVSQEPNRNVDEESAPMKTKNLTFELPDFLFTSAASPTRGHVPNDMIENLDEEDIITYSYVPSSKKELCPLDVCVVKLPAHQSYGSEKRKKRRRRKQDVSDNVYFSDELEEQLQRFDTKKKTPSAPNTFHGSNTPTNNNIHPSSNSIIKNIDKSSLSKDQPNTNYPELKVCPILKEDINNKTTGSPAVRTLPPLDKHIGVLDNTETLINSLQENLDMVELGEDTSVDCLERALESKLKLVALWQERCNILEAEVSITLAVLASLNTVYQHPSYLFRRGSRQRKVCR